MKSRSAESLRDVTSQTIPILVVSTLDIPESLGLGTQTLAHSLALLMTHGFEPGKAR